MTDEYGDKKYRFQKTAIDYLRHSAEAYLTSLFELSYRMTIQGKRVTLMPKDIDLALYLLESYFHSPLGSIRGQSRKDPIETYNSF